MLAKPFLPSAKQQIQTDYTDVNLFADSITDIETETLKTAEITANAADAALARKQGVLHCCATV